MRQYIVQAPLERLIPIGWNEDRAEAGFMLIEVLEQELGYLSSQDGLYQITAKGRLYLEGTTNQPSSIGFCAMWFSPDIRYLYDEVLAPSIRTCGYEPLRVDGAEHNGKIDDEIVASIRRARFVIADFTEHRSGVYYEAGFAHGLGLPVIFMCRADQLERLHFDVRQYNTVDWNEEDLEAARHRLKNRILATIGQGPRVS